MNIRLPAAEHNGLYAAPADIAALRRAARAAGLAWHVIDLQRARGRRALFTAFARGFGFPATFGGNWDALADCLQDLSWQATPDRMLQLRGTVTFAAAAAEDFALLCEILNDTASYWREHGRLFVVLAEDAAGWPSWPLR